MPDEVDQDEADQKFGIVKAHRDRLMEHFHSVQIIAISHDGDGSMIHSAGGGEYYSRIGAMRMWLDRESIEKVDDDD